jgi:acetoacetyl-CoA synthetase
LKKPLWTPTKDRIKNSNLSAFIKYVRRYNKNISSYDELYNWSINEPEAFWKFIWDKSRIVHSKKYKKILSSDQMPGAQWFEGAKLNFAENLLKYKGNRTAIISSREDQPNVKLTYKQLYAKVSSCANGLKKLGVKRGDRVAGFVPNYPESIVAMLAATSLGALWSSCSPDFGLKGVLDRFGQIQPKVLFAIEEYQYNGKVIDCREKIQQIRDAIPDIKCVILMERFYDFQSPKTKQIKLNNKNNYLYFKDLVSLSAKELKFVQLPFNHPVYVMYSSGTTGIPKCIVHGAGGTLLQHYKEHALHTDLKRSDVITYFTTCGWMMWNWLVSALQIGATIFLYDGSPVYPDPEILWKKIETEKISVFGTSPKFLTISQKGGIIPGNKFNLSSLKTILSTGSPLSAENFKWVYKKVKRDLQLSSISGGTDIISCFMLGNPVLPVFSEEIQCRGLGMKVESFGENGEPVIGEKGELVCTKPFPSMPVFFWNDPKGKKYKSAYFEKYPGVWHHGDFIKITGRGGVIVYGRSDATLNPGGVRIGTAEIYRIVEAMDEIADSLVIGQEWENDVRIILFIVLKRGIKLNSALNDKIKMNIRNSATPRHVPYRIIEIKDVPRTISGKKVEIAVSRLINGQKIDNKDALINPDSLQQFLELRPVLFN